ncbi:6149_t:CDS:1, partial [Gigaspora margarita]
MSINITLPSVEEVNEWWPTDVVTFLGSNKKKLFLEDKHIKVIEDEEVAGSDFLVLDVEKLMKYGLKGGPAERIAKLVRDIKGEDQGK